MAETQNDQSTESRWFEADCARRYIDQAEDWNLRHTALKDWSINWISKDGDEALLCTFTREPPAAATILKQRTEMYRVEFDALSREWIRDTKHLSLVSKKIGHPAFLRIVGMGEPAIPLILEALRDRPAHWFAALRATANVDPVPADANPSQAREAWLSWGRSAGYID